jgi:hypothetical protein
MRRIRQMLDAIVERKIRASFPLNPMPDPDEAVEKTYCVDHLHERLAGKKWNEPSIADYRFCDDGFSLLTVKGLHYYLPGYLLAEVVDPETSDVLAEYVTFTLADDGSDFSQRRLAEMSRLVTDDQIEAIALWLALYALRYEVNTDVRKCFKTLEDWSRQRNSN